MAVCSVGSSRLELRHTNPANPPMRMLVGSPASAMLKLTPSQPDHLPFMLHRLGNEVRELPLPGAAGKLKGLKPAHAQQLEGASQCLRLDRKEFEDVCTAHRVVVTQLAPALQQFQQRGGDVAKAQQALAACTCILRVHDGNRVSYL